MKKRETMDFADTVSYADDQERVIQSGGIRPSSFDYQQFCRNVLDISKRKADACFLLPLKAYHSQEEIRKEESLLKLESCMDAFVKEGNACEYFWPYLVYVNDYRMLWETESIFPNAEASAKGCMNDVSKLEKSAYMKHLCKARGMDEFWILKSYELMVKKRYPGSKLSLFVQDVIQYLQSCGLKLSMPVLGSAQGGEVYLAQTAAGLMLLAVRLRMGIPETQAMEWYRQGNAAYLRCSDRKLEEYMQVVENHSYHSYERFVVMCTLAKEKQNKYAAKEAGDVYRTGAVLLDSYGTEISIPKDLQAASEYYWICGLEKYIPSYSAALKTGMLTKEQQCKELLDQARGEQHPDALAFYAHRCLEEAEQYITQDPGRGLVAFKNLVDSVLTMEVSYWETHVLKNEILSSGTYQFCKDTPNMVSRELRELLCELYGKDPFAMEQKELEEEMAHFYQRAGNLGYFEVDYRLAKLVQKTAPDDSRDLFLQGAQKGCNWCMLECAKFEKEQNCEKWLKSLMEIGKNQIPDGIKFSLAQELSQCDCVLDDMEKGKIVWQQEELMDLYSQITRIENWLDGCTTGRGRKEKQLRVRIQSELLERQLQVWKLIIKDREEI